MDAFFTWLQDLPISVWVAESESLWAFPFILFLHTMGIALSAGCSGVVLMRVLGAARPLRLNALRVLFPWFWTGFVLNAFSGTLLFMAAATRTGYNRVFYAKLVLVLFAVLTLLPVRRFLHGDLATDATRIPSSVKRYAAASLLLWTGAVATGRLIAYL